MFRWRFALLASALVVVLCSAVFVAWQLPAQAASPGWITSCNLAKEAQVDPIASPGVIPSEHLHEFVGAKAIDENSTPDSLRAGGTTCLTAGDDSGYWIPAAYEDGAKVGFATTKHALFYYRRKGAPSGVTVRPFPDGLKLVVGNAHATSEATNPAIASGNATFKCGPGSGTETPRPPAQCASGVLVMVFILPNCWNGTDLDSPDHFSHMTYPVSGRCPATYPVVLPRIQAFWRLNVGTDPISLTLSSGDYYTAHMDFFNAWQPASLQSLVTRCINGFTDCGTDPTP